jgi:DNA-binding winged helix-turn-helix (wHTH) protein/tetratricopeptide (TPR) repeat protein
MTRATTFERNPRPDYALAGSTWEAQLLSFPPFRLDLHSERLWKHDQELHLRRKPFAILLNLVQNPQRLVTHAEIVEAVWGKVAMSESLLRTHVRDLRQVLGEGVVETVVGRGYRFVAEVKRLELEAPRGETGGSVVQAGGKVVVGRGPELDALRAALRSARERRRTTVFVTGEAGVGKTTVVDFFLEQESAQNMLLMGRGACVEQYGSGQAYLPVLDAIGTLCRGRGGDRVLDIMAKYAPTWLVQMPVLVRSDRLDELQRRTVGASQARTLRELAEALEALSVDAPVVVVFDDLQWTDPSTAELLAILGSRREPARLLLVGTYRPAEVSRGHQVTRVVGELIAHRQASAIALEGFAAEAVEAYLSGRFPGHRFPPELTQTLHRSTGGNPLFVATLVDDLEGQGFIRERDGARELSISVEGVAARRPDGIRWLIDTQIDRLVAVEQRIIEVAGVAGMTFTAGVVAHALETDADTVDSACETLANERRLLQYVGTERWPDGTIQSRYAFGHTLFQHAALARSSSANARTRHRKIAERLEAGYAGQEEQVAGELAVHFEQGQVPAKAAHYHVVAGDRAARGYGLRAAVTNYEHALAIVAGLPESRDRDLLDLRASLGLGWRHWQLIGSLDAATPVLLRAKELATRLQDNSSLAEALIRLNALCLARGDLREAAEHARAIAPLLDHVSDDALRVFAKDYEATTVLLRGDFEEARRLLDALGVFRSTEETTLPELQSEHFVALVMGAFTSWLTGKPDQAVVLARRACEAAETIDDPFERAGTLSDWATLHAWRREPEKAGELAKRSLALAEKAFGSWQTRAETVLRWAQTELAPASSQQRAEELLSKPWAGGGAGRTMQALLYVSMCARLGRADRALEVISSTLEAIERSDERWLEPELHRLRGEMLKSADKAEAERSIATAIDIARKQASRSLELRATLSLHALVSGTKKKRAREDLARLLSLITEGHDTPDLVEARAVVES